MADNLFWLGRYTDRIESMVRIARAILARFQEGDAVRAAGLNAGLEILTALGYLEEAEIAEKSAPERERLSTAEREVLAMIYDPSAPNGLVSGIHQVRGVAWLLRDRISVDAWLILNQLDQQFSAVAPAEAFRISARAGPAESRHHHALRFLRPGHGEHDPRRWLAFLDIGRRLERAAQMVGLLRHGLHADPPSLGVLEAILEMADSSITYRSRYLTSLQTDLVLDLLLVDEANPRSIAFQLARLKEHVDRLPVSHVAIRRPLEARQALALLTGVQLADVRELGRIDEPAAAAARDALFEKLSADLGAFSETLSRAYFSHAAQSRQLAAP